MAAGDLTASTPTLCEGAAAVKTHIDTLNTNLDNDMLYVIPVTGRSDVYLVFKVEREPNP